MSQTPRRRWNRTRMYVFAALALACLLILGGALYVRQGRALLQGRFEQIKQAMLEQKEAGELPEEWQGMDLENLQLAQVGIKLPHGEHLQITIAEALASLSWVLVPLVFGLSLAAAWVAGRLWPGS